MSVKTMLQRLVGMKADLATTAQEMRQGFDDVRAELTEKRAELHRAKTLLPPPEELDANVDAVVDEKGAGHAREYGLSFLQHLAGQATHPALANRDAPPRMPPTFPPANPLDPDARECFLDPEGMKARLRRGIRAIPYEAGLPIAERGLLIERLTREVAELESAEEQMVDELAEAGIVVQHRPEVISRRVNEARARELKEQKEKDQAWIEEQTRLGNLGTPRVVNPGWHRG